MSAKDGLAHPVAELDGGELVEVGDLQSRCGGVSTHREALRIVEAGKDRRMRSTRCGSLLYARLPDPNEMRWHFAKYPGEPACTHDDPDDLDSGHSAAVRELREALAAANPEWKVGWERWLKRVRRRADILAAHRSTGTGVVIEVQKSPPNRAMWEARREALASTGIAADFWFMLDRGVLPWKDRSSFAELLREKPDQRFVYLGNFKDDKEELQGYEQVVYYELEHPIPAVASESYIAAPDEELPRGARNVRRRWIPYPLSKIRLVEEDGDAQSGQGRVRLYTGRDEHLKNHREKRWRKVRQLEAEDEARRKREAQERKVQERQEAEAAPRPSPDEREPQYNSCEAREGLWQRLGRVVREWLSG